MGALRTLDAQAIEDIALGAAVLGTGGGGDPFIGKLMALQTVEECGPIRLISLDEVPDDAVCVPIGMMGAPTVVVEKLPSGTEMESAFSLLSDFLGRSIDAAVPVEAGGLNSMIPLALAGRLGLPVVDGDGMGRAFPELQLSTFHLAGVEATPMVIADEKGNSVILKATDAFAGERIARANCVVMGGSVMATAYTMTGAQVKRAAIGGIVTFSEEIGRTLRTAAHRGLDPIEELLRVTRGHRLFHGKIVDVERRTAGGFVRGRARFEGIGEDRGRAAVVSFQNENLVAEVDGRVLATVPDLITVLDQETGRPITTESLRYGQRVVVVGMPANERWRTPEGLALAGPRAFGYDLDFIPVEERVAAARAGAAEGAGAGGADAAGKGGDA